ncbi:hypothetical protein O9993_08330 [Vibrio lentus]|nr:hypothetical protein [Vibrio lentus]
MAFGLLIGAFGLIASHQ